MALNSHKKELYDSTKKINFANCRANLIFVACVYRTIKDKQSDMAEVITMPRMSDTMEEGNIVASHRHKGRASANRCGHSCYR